jgi:class 3 adenylate cyclase
MQQIADWLKKLGMSEYIQRFAENDIDVSVLRHLTDQDLKEIGVSLGHRRKMLVAIAELAGAAPVTPQPAAPPEPKPHDDAERRQLTVMFTDLVGSTALSTMLDPEDPRSVFGSYHKCVADTVARLDGFVAKYMGDGVLVYFGYPQAHEDDAERAVRAGLALIEAVHRLGSPRPLQVRIGVATGLVVVGELVDQRDVRERAVVGETPNLAARLQSLAEPNTLVIGPSTRRLLGDLFEYRDLGTVEVKGFAELVRAWQVLREGTFESRFEAFHSAVATLTTLIGREEELELLLRRWHQARDGDGRVVLVSGEPGIGKSRLARAIQERLATEPHTRIRYFCSPHHLDSPLFPIIGQLERAAGFARSNPVEAKLVKLRALFEPGSRSEEDMALLAELLSLARTGPELDLTPQRKREKTLEALLHQLDYLAQRQPVLMLFEDVHWIDPTSRELLDYIVDRGRRLPILLIITFRPEFQPAWSGQPHVTILTLNRLSRRNGAALVQGLAGNLAPADDVVDEILERTDGVPLFIEELTKAVLESADREDRIAAVLSTAPLPAIAIPATLHASLIARLDRLGAVAKEIAQVAAVLGREFSHELVGLVAQWPEAELRTALQRLTVADLLFCRGVAPQSVYWFKHALVQDAAYGTLLRGKRQELHVRVAAVLEERFVDVIDRQPELLAHHLTAAGETRRAIDWWLQAGKHAAQRSAHLEAIAHFERALALTSSLPKASERDIQEIEIQIARGLSLFTNRGFGSTEAAEVYGRAADLCEKLGDDGHLFTALFGLWLSSTGRGDSAAALNLSDKLLVLAQNRTEAGLRLQAHHTAWTTHFRRAPPAS